MKRYQYSQRGLTLFEVSVAISVAIMLLMAFTSFYLKIVERSLIEQTVYRAKLVYEGALAYRIDNKQWPGSITVLTSGSYIPRLAAETSWGEDIITGVDHSNLIMYIPTPSKPIADSIAARLPAAEAAKATATIGDSVSVTIIPPGQEFSLASLQDLEGTRAWTGHHEAGNNDLTDVHTLKAKFIVTDEVQLGGSCSASEVEEDRDKPGKGARAMAEVTDGVSVPVLCNGTEWVREDQYALLDCQVCIACSDHEHGNWRNVACDKPDNDGWAVAASPGFCFSSSGRLAVKFVCGSDLTAGKFPSVAAQTHRNFPHEYYPTDQDWSLEDLVESE